MIISHKNQKEKKLNLFKFKKKDLNIKIENDYLNNFISPKPDKKVNNIFEKKIITDNINNENRRHQRKINIFKNDIKIIS